MHIDDVRKTIEAVVGNLNPTKAQELARGLLEPGAAKDQVAKTAADMLEWSQRNRERLRGFVRREIEEQMRAMGVATHSDLDAVKKRVRTLERASGMTASGRAKTSSARTKVARGSAAARPSSTGSSARSGSKLAATGGSRRASSRSTAGTRSSTRTATPTSRRRPATTSG